MTRLVLVIALFLRLSFALEVTANSPCSMKCIDDPKNGDPSLSNSSITLGADIVCEDADLVGSKATDLGKKYVDCQNCLQYSRYEDSESGERDSTWFMLNNRAAVDWCLFGRMEMEENKDVSSSRPYKECFSACNKIYASSNNKVVTDPSKYDYCDSDGNYTDDAQSCMKCLYDSDGLTILGNIITALTHFCQTKPGKNIGFDEHIYETKRISLGNSSDSNSSNSSDTAPKDAPKDPKADSPDPKDGSKSGISTAAIAGIAVGGLVAIAAILAGILFYLRRLRKQKKIVEPPYSGANDVPPYSAPAYNYEPLQKYGHHQPMQENVQHELQQPSAPIELGTARNQGDPAELG